MSIERHTFIEDLEPARAHLVWHLVSLVDSDPERVIVEATDRLRDDELRLFALEARDEHGHDVASVLWDVQQSTNSSTVRARVNWVLRQI